jgi:hypothetical protein
VRCSSPAAIAEAIAAGLDVAAVHFYQAFHQCQANPKGTLRPHIIPMHLLARR